MNDPTDQMKETMRVELLTRRRSMSGSERVQAAQALAMHAMGWQPLTSARRVACYLSTPEEPDTSGLLELFTARGIEVLLPVVGADRTLDWALADGATAEGPWGIREPAGPRLGSAALNTCDIAFLPALAVDHAGHRLGRGGGFYDKALAEFTGVRCAIVFTHELVESLPVEDHDQRVDNALSPGGIFRVL